MGNLCAKCKRPECDAGIFCGEKAACPTCKQSNCGNWAGCKVRQEWKFDHEWAVQSARQNEERQRTSWRWSWENTFARIAHEESLRFEKRRLEWRASWAEIMGEYWVRAWAAMRKRPTEKDFHALQKSVPDVAQYLTLRGQALARKRKAAQTATPGRRERIEHVR